MSARTPILWKWKIPCKIKIFLWLALQGRLLCKVYRAKWRPEATTDCVLCGTAPETIEHLFTNCPFSIRVGFTLAAATGIACSFQNLDEMWEAMAGGQGQGDGQAQARFKRIVIPAGMWAIWRVRNERIFKNQPVYFENLWEDLMSLL
ncbi:hypothetical protein QJS10_CPA01g01385 [Acorus calamus]|uniref:Reverse transcriptase zinc-binding domain-containing protein n=1 Tax=Acorus calamus TaxID=4465 RepID=A0AAV9FFU2_ACOCL|nr:hypothetical protein QJS10_CPA01g01385 [Acorus calamus]